jgi:anti-anti-sigma factor
MTGQATGSPALPCRFSVDGAVGSLRFFGERGQNAGAEPDGALDLASTRAPVLILDLGHVSLMDAGAGSLLVRADRRIRRAGGRLLVVAGSDDVQWLFAVTGIDRLLELVDPPPAPMPDHTPPESTRARSFSQ